MPNLTERYLVPGERRVVDTETAGKLRMVAAHAALQVGCDKVTAAVVLADYAVELFASNVPAYGPVEVREAFERAIVVHFGTRVLAPNVTGGRS